MQRPSSSALGLLLAGCGGGNSAPAPTDLKVVAGDTSATITSQNLLGLTFTSGTTTGVSSAVAVGSGGAAFFSTDSINWTTVASNVAIDLNAAVYATSHFLVVGNGGTLLTSVDGAAWSPQASPTAANLYGVTSNGAATSVAVGASGTIIVSSDGTTWAAANSQTTADLYGVTFANGLYVAVGANGVIVTSPDGGQWTAIPPITSANLRKASYGAYVAGAAAAVASTWVAVGDGGTLLTSADGVAWVTQPPITGGNLTSIAHGTQFIAVGTGGNIFTSDDGVAWQPAVYGVTQDLHAVVFTVLTGGSVGVGYLAVGNHGTNLSSF